MVWTHHCFSLQSFPKFPWRDVDGVRWRIIWLRWSRCRLDSCSCAGRRIGREAFASTVGVWQ